MSSSANNAEPGGKRVKLDHDASLQSYRIHETTLHVQPIKRQCTTVTLLPAEQLLRQLLLDCRDDLVATAAVPKLELWFTGGWVRDKLLGITSPDIDTALSSMTGMHFGAALETFFTLHRDKYVKQAEQSGITPEFKGLHRVAQRPEKSKNLETAMTRIFGLDLDLVNLRGEVYAENSRHPQMEFATAEEDASRRDATVNSLFFNLDTQQVEDHTGKGLDDMEAGVIRTPLEPFQTFTDDPLRVLRLIRFASKLGYGIDDKSKLAMKDAKIHEAFHVKISRERVGTEAGKMMTGRHPQVAFQLIYELDLYPVVFFSLPPEASIMMELKASLPDTGHDRPWPATWPHAYRILTAMKNDEGSLGKMLAPADDQQDSQWLMAAYAPIAALRGKHLEQAVKIASESLKLTNKHSKILPDALKNLDHVRSTVDLVTQQSSCRRSEVGMPIRAWGTTWRNQVLYSLLAGAVSSPTDTGFFSHILTRYASFTKYIEQQNLHDAATIKPILTGNDIMQIFEVKKSGPFIKDALNRLVEWQFDHPGAERGAAVEWTREQRDVLNVPTG